VAYTATNDRQPDLEELVLTNSASTIQTIVGSVSWRGGAARRAERQGGFVIANDLTLATTTLFAGTNTGA